jgi:hypothetical protein
MTLNELLNEEAEKLLTERAKHRAPSKKLANYDTDKYLSKNEKKKMSKARKSQEILPGRERLITAVCNKCGASRGAVATYVNRKFDEWFNKDPKAEWIAKLEKKAREMETQSFNPRDYRKSLTTPMPRGASAGKSSIEHNGRAYFFVGLMNGFANHFKKGLNK